jgi:hypothetical protein
MGPYLLLFHHFIRAPCQNIQLSDNQKHHWYINVQFNNNPEMRANSSPSKSISFLQRLNRRTSLNFQKLRLSTLQEHRDF